MGSEGKTSIQEVQDGTSTTMYILPLDPEEGGLSRREQGGDKGQLVRGIAGYEGEARREEAKQI
jgi:hypothetical protein